MNKKKDLKKYERTLRWRLIVLCALAVILATYLCYSIWSDLFFIDGPITIKAEIDGEEHYLVCQNIIILGIDGISEEDRIEMITPPTGTAPSLEEAEEQFYGSYHRIDGTIPYFSCCQWVTEKGELRQIKKEFVDCGTQIDDSKIDKPTIEFRGLCFSGKHGIIRNSGVQTVTLK